MYFLNTVIGKMSEVISDAGEIQPLGLATATSQGRRAFLVEVFNRILISRMRFEETSGKPGFQRAFTAFAGKEDLLQDC
jgi:hypothetical protein